MLKTSINKLKYMVIWFNDSRQMEQSTQSSFSSALLEGWKHNEYEMNACIYNI